MREENTEGLTSFNDILKELKTSTKVIEIGNLRFTELNHKQQRKILNSGQSAVEVPVRFSNIYNEFIGENVVITDDMVNSLDGLDIVQKPFVLVALRNMSLGNQYYDDDSDMMYTLPDITADMLKTHLEPRTIKFGDFKLVVEVPNLVRDTKYNQLLILALEPFKKKNVGDAELGKVADIYQTYNLIKFIKTVSYRGGKDWDFDEVPKNSKDQFINHLPADVIDQITQYTTEAFELGESALKAVNKETGKSIDVSVNTLFFATSKEPKKQKENKEEVEA